MAALSVPNRVGKALGDLYLGTELSSCSPQRLRVEPVLMALEIPSALSHRVCASLFSTRRYLNLLKSQSHILLDAQILSSKELLAPKPLAVFSSAHPSPSAYAEDSTCLFIKCSNKKEFGNWSEIPSL